MKTNSFVARSVIVPAAGASLIFSLALFGLMYSVIKAGHSTLEKKEALPTIDFVRLKRDSEVETLSRKPPCRPRRRNTEDEDCWRSGGLKLGLDIPTLDQPRGRRTDGW
jgi:hypothetical protein